MKRSSKIAAFGLALITVFVFSCKKNEAAYDNVSNDSIDTTVDSIGPAIDSSAALNSGQNGTNGTTGAVGEGSTGSGTAGSTQKGNQNVKTDSISK
ncbi:hypothetical protein J2Y38_004598 [Flavobacterium sp. 2755]|uniref:hypothetical protein n=1 Tax=Flavobacterium sp. 2755 TaxID=2817765 RepID=UPI00285E9503|nr:hypothetical protein [Flavobacterium sp. 2755]MDR6764365.1 hypothetical protein [Flavobacterium sp. 2755]